MLKERVARIVDNILACDALIVLDLDKGKVADIKNWSDKRQEAHYTLRNTSLAQILNLFKSEVDKLTVIDDEEIKEVEKGWFDALHKDRDEPERLLVQAQLQHTKKQLLDLMGE